MRALAWKLPGASSETIPTQGDKNKSLKAQFSPAKQPYETTEPFER